jgi:nitroreductase
MEKPASAEYPIHELLVRRWSPRAFSDRTVEADKLRRLFEAARWAPSCNNAQPWRFLMARREERTEHDRLLHCLLEGNVKWAHRAPVLILSVAKLTFDNGTSNRHAWHDVGMATENLLLQATEMGLSAHPMAGFHVEKVRLEFSIPSDYEPVAVIAVGYPGDPALLPDYLRERELKPRARESSMTFVFSGEWGRPSSAVR